MCFLKPCLQESKHRKNSVGNNVAVTSIKRSKETQRKCKNQNNRETEIKRSPSSTIVHKLLFSIEKVKVKGRLRKFGHPFFSRGTVGGGKWVAENVSGAAQAQNRWDRRAYRTFEISCLTSTLVSGNVRSNCLQPLEHGAPRVFRVDRDFMTECSDFFVVELQKRLRIFEAGFFV